MDWSKRYSSFWRSEAETSYRVSALEPSNIIIYYVKRAKKPICQDVQL
jgi:hypothetical protein